MAYLLCEGCGNVVLDDLFDSHIIVGSNNAPTGGKRKEDCPIWLMKNATKKE